MSALEHLADWRTGWSMGAFGAIAEFHQDDGERAVSAWRKVHDQSADADGEDDAPGH